MIYPFFFNVLVQYVLANRAKRSKKKNTMTIFFFEIIHRVFKGWEMHERTKVKWNSKFKINLLFSFSIINIFIMIQIFLKPLSTLIMIKKKKILGIEIMTVKITLLSSNWNNNGFLSKLIKYRILQNHWKLNFVLHPIRDLTTMKKNI